MCIFCGWRNRRRSSRSPVASRQWRDPGRRRGERGLLRLAPLAQRLGCGLRRPQNASTSTTAAQGAASAQDDTRGISVAAEEKQIPRGLKPARDDNQKIDAGRGPEGPLYPNGANAGRGAEAPLYRSDAEVFRAFADAGRKLADLHVNYEQQSEYPLERIEKGRLNYRVEKMRLSKDKTTLIYNDFLTLKGIPPETYEYRLGNRSALEWVIDQYQVSTDKRSGITNDPNREDDPEYIVRLVGQVITVSLETMKIVKGLPEWAVDVPDRMQ